LQQVVEAFRPHLTSSNRQRDARPSVTATVTAQSGANPRFLQRVVETFRPHPRNSSLQYRQGWCARREALARSHVASTTPRLSGIDVLIAYLRPHHKEYEYTLVFGIVCNTTGYNRLTTSLQPARSKERDREMHLLSSCTPSCSGPPLHACVVRIPNAYILENISARMCCPFSRGSVTRFTPSTARPSQSNVDLCKPTSNGVGYLVNTNSRWDYEVNKFTESTPTPATRNPSHDAYKLHKYTFITSTSASSHP
jgi:hypothetical protein